MGTKKTPVINPAAKSRISSVSPAKARADKIRTAEFKKENKNSHGFFGEKLTRGSVLSRIGPESKANDKAYKAAAALREAKKSSKAAKAVRASKNK